MPAEVVANHSIVRLEHGNLLVPHATVKAEAVDQYNRLARARHFVVQPRTRSSSLVARRRARAEQTCSQHHRRSQGLRTLLPHAVLSLRSLAYRYAGKAQERPMSKLSTMKRIGRGPFSRLLW